MTDQKRLGRPPIHGEPTRTVRFVCPDSVNEALQEEALETKVSRSQVVVEALRGYLSRRLKVRGRNAAP